VWWRPWVTSGTGSEGGTGGGDTSAPSSFEVPTQTDYELNFVA